MNRGSKNSRGGKKAQQFSWQQKPSDSPHIPQTTLVGDDVSPSGIVSSTSDAKSHSSGQGAKHISGGSINQNVTPAYRQGGGWSTFSGSSSRGGTARQSTAYSKGTNVSDFSRDKQIGLRSGQLRSGGKNIDKLSSDNTNAWSEGASESSPFDLDCTFMESLDHRPDVGQLSGESLPVKSCSGVKIPESIDSSPENKTSESSVVKFDLCPPKSSTVVLKTPLHIQNKERRKEIERSTGGLKNEILRPGMVLLKNYLSTFEQAGILKICRLHGLETVGFEQPSFGEGGKLHLKLMCFGKYWSCETNKYGDVRPIDNAKPPPVPQSFLELVDRAVKDSQSFISETSRAKNVELILPSVKPDICLVNYYSKTGRLGLHQDKDESRESLDKGIPIVSFSIGDAAEFLYGDTRDTDKAESVTLESGDVLIFGGKARHIFHGVREIKSGTTPKLLLDETNFCSGRLNLTFRQRF